MYVVKRDGTHARVSFDEITERIRSLSEGLNVEPVEIAQKTISSINSGISTSKLDAISAANAYDGHAIENPDYSTLAVRLIVSNLHKSTESKFSAAMLYISQHAPRRLAPKYIAYIQANASALDAMIDDSADYNYDYFGINTLLRTYLIKVGDVVRDRPQYMYMRVAIMLWMDSDDALGAIRRCYDGLSRHYYTHATPTLINACTSTSQLNSCFLFGVQDNIVDIMRLVTDVSLTSKAAGGIGIHMSKIRANGSIIATTGGAACGVPRQLCIINECIKAWNQGGVRAGAAAAFLEIWHADILEFIRMKRPDTKSTHAPDMFYGIWCCNLFMKRLTDGKPWTLFSEDTAPFLTDVHDGMHVCAVCDYCDNPRYAEMVAAVWPDRPQKIRCDSCKYEMRDVFTELYTEYEKRGLGRRTVDPDMIMTELAITASQTGVPYMCHKDHVNAGSAQMNIDTVHGSNLCTEIMEVTTDNTIACCALASINLTEMVNADCTDIDYVRLTEVVTQIVHNLDRSIDINRYPSDRCVPNASKWRPIGVGVQGMADMFARLRIPFLSERAAEIDMMIFETIYHAALSASADLAKSRGAYTGWETSPAARGLLRHDLWKMAAYMRDGHVEPFDSGRYNWDTLRAKISASGLRHSLHVALMPTASTAQILGNNESFEPFSSLIYAKNVIGGKQTVINERAIREFIRGGWWDDSTRVRVTNTGSIAGCDNIPAEVRDIYRTVWDMPQKPLIARAARRQQFIDQAQSLNIHLTAPVGEEHVNYETIVPCYYEGWRLGLPTGSYYIRTRPGAKPLETNVARVKNTPAAPTQPDGDVCYPGCDSCSG